ncbi:MAG: hypothetical protein LBU89_00815 [Fibromonadaceae bacterium]|jgi:hypothetical protein|nr:hypothetical protein [Fibromonadaceae bacterium]
MKKHFLDTVFDKENNRKNNNELLESIDCKLDTITKTIEDSNKVLRIISRDISYDLARIDKDVMHSADDMLNEIIIAKLDDIMIGMRRLKDSNEHSAYYIAKKNSNGRLIIFLIILAIAIIVPSSDWFMDIVVVVKKRYEAALDRYEYETKKSNKVKNNNNTEKRPIPAGLDLTGVRKHNDSTAEKGPVPANLDPSRFKKRKEYDK